MNDDVWKLPLVEIVGQPLPDGDEEPAHDEDAYRTQAADEAVPPVADLVAQIRKQDDALDELVMSAELAVLYRDDRTVERLRAALAGWREASGDTR